MDRARVLCVQRTGWGKSAVYFVATALLREAGAGPTLIVSPLLALMRNQIAAAQRLGLRAHTINSTNREEWDEVRDRLAARHHRPAADQPRAAEQPAVSRAHAAAVRRLGGTAGDRRGALHLGLGPRLPARLPARQGHARRARAGRRGAGHHGHRQRSRRRRRARAARGSGGEPLRSYRGPLARTSLRLEVLELPRPAAAAGVAGRASARRSRARGSSTR